MASEVSWFSREPAKLERALWSHVRLQNQIADRLIGRGLAPLSPRSVDPDFDLAWRDGRELNVVEVKSLHTGNELSQLRGGLGQILDYRHRLERRHGVRPRAILALEREPKRQGWVGICSDVDVQLIWGPQLDGLLAG